MNVLVTGASGFIGKEVCSHLAKNGHQVTAAVRKLNSVGVSNEVSVEYIEVNNIGDFSGWSSILRSIDCVVHLAASAHKLNMTNGLLGEAFESDRKSIKRLVECAINANVARFVFVSSVKVYGENFCTTTMSTLDELSEVGSCCDAYGLSKLSAEKHLQTELKNSTMDFVIIRSPLVYGPQVKANFASLLSLLKTGIPLPFAGVHNKRSMLAIDNLVSFIDCCIVNERAKNQIYLVSDDDDVSLSRLALSIRDAMHVSRRLFYLPLVVLKLMAILIGRKQPIEKLTGSFKISCQKAKQQLGWQPVISVENAIIKTVEEYMKNR